MIWAWLGIEGTGPRPTTGASLIGRRVGQIRPAMVPRAGPIFSLAALRETVAPAAEVVVVVVVPQKGRVSRIGGASDGCSWPWQSLLPEVAASLSDSRCRGSLRGRGMMIELFLWGC